MRCHDVSMTQGRLVLAGTPLGNPHDASSRLRDLLATATLIAAEDTRKVHGLASRLGITMTGRVVSNFEGNEAARAESLIDEVQRGGTVVVVSDAGMPGVSDPGFRVARAAIDADIPIEVLPGGSAVTTALVMSGLPMDRFCFEGFLPRAAGERQSRLRELLGEPRTMVFFEAPHRLAVTLAAMAQVWGGEREAAVCREMTKTYEEVVRGSLEELHTWATGGVRGEITLVVRGADAESQRVSRGLATDADVLAAIAAAEESGLTRKEAIAYVAKEAGRPRRDVYELVIHLRSEHG